MGKKSKRTRTKQTEKEKMDAIKNVVSAVREAGLLGVCYTTNKQKKTLGRNPIGEVLGGDTRPESWSFTVGGREVCYLGKEGVRLIPE